MLTSRSMNKQIVVCLHNRIPLSIKKERTLNICANTDESQNNYAEEKKPDKKEFILYDTIYIKF